MLKMQYCDFEPQIALYQLYPSHMNSRVFRIDNDPNLLANRPSTKDRQRRLQRVTKEAANNRQFLYIDINTESGYRLMYQCDSSDEEEEMDRIGRKYRVNLNDLTTPNYKGINYLYKMKKFGQKKQRALSMVKDQLQRSTDKLIDSIPIPENSTRYLLKKAPDSQRSTASKNDSKLRSKPKQNKLITLLSKSLSKQLSQSPKYYTIDSNRSSVKRRSPEQRTEKYLQRIRLILPGIVDVRKASKGGGRSK